MWSRNKVIASVVAVVIALPLAYFLVTKYVKLDFKVVENPLEYVTVIDNSRPGSGEPLQVMKRWDRDTKVKWGTRLFQDHLPAYGGESLKANRATIEAAAKVPRAKDDNLFGVATNALDAGSVKANGTFYLLWFAYPPSAESWLKRDEKIFTDPAAEKVRKTYWSGAFVLYYSPPEAPGKDWTSAIPPYLGEVAICSAHADPCPNALTPSPSPKD